MRVTAAYVERRYPGFTLLEILVVIAILGIAAGLSLALVAPGERDVSAREARRFAGAIEFATERAQLRGETLGVSATAHALRFWRRDAENDRWLIVDDNDVLRERILPGAIDAGARLFAGRSVAPDVIVPLRASGRNEPFLFMLVAPGWQTSVALDPLNRVSIGGPAPIEP